MMFSSWVCWILRVKLPTRLARWIFFVIFGIPFSHIVIREVKSVDSKDKVREQLRFLFRQKGSDARKRRLHLRARLHDYRKSIRAERLVYYSARTDAVDKSDSFMSFITDGASSE